MTKHRRRPFRLTEHSSAHLGRIDWHGLGDDPIGEMEVFIGATTAHELQSQLDTQIHEEVNAILAATEEFDAFDVIELLRLRELPVVPVVGLMEGYDGSGAAVDLVSLILLSRPSRMPSGKSRQETQPHSVIPQLHDRATRLLRLATYMRAAQVTLVDDDQLARLASEYQSYLVSVRALQYESVQEKHDRALFDRPEIEALLMARLGFNYRDFVAVREAIQDRYSRILTSLRDTTGDIAMRAKAEGRDPAEEEIETFRESMRQFMFLPAERAAFAVRDIAEEAGLEPSRVEAVLNSFSVDFDGDQDAAEVVRDFLRGSNPLAKTCLVRDADGQHIMTGVQIGTDSFRSVAESALKGDSKAWRRYDRTRAEVSETLAIDALGRVLQTSAAHTNLKYFGPKRGVEPEALSGDCTTPAAFADQAESDGLFVLDDVAICVEVKGRTISGPARRGDLARLKTEVDNVFGTGAGQARRLESLIRSNGGVWLEDGTWLDLGGVREVRSVVVGLDVFGPLAVALGDLESSGLLGSGSLPWITSLHDLEVISKIVDRPAEFLLYLRRRTDSGVATHYRGSDELDLFMLFLDGGLYVEPDPDEVQRRHPMAPPPRDPARKRHDADARSTVVGTFTDLLDAWMYWHEGTSPFEVEKPTLSVHESIQEIIDFLADGRKPGWFRFSADLFALSGRAQKKVGDFLRELVRQTRTDHQWHTMMQGFAGLWGYPTLFAGSKPRNLPHDSAVQKLRTYVAAKKHQVQSDRSLGLLINEDREIVYVIYMNGVPTEDPELDELGAAIGLMPAGQASPPIPPSAMRSTHRLRGKRAKRRRRR